MKTSRILLPLALCLLCTPARGDVRTLASEVSEVTLYGSSALVRRTAAAAGGGSYLIEGLPGSLDADSLRVRCKGGHVVSVELRERFLRELPEARIQELRDALRVKHREREALEGELALQQDLSHYLARLMKQEAAAWRAELESGRGTPEAWSESYGFLSAQLTENLGQQRQLRWRLEDCATAVAQLKEELGRWDSQPGVRLQDLYLRVDSEQKALVVEVDYLVEGAGWQPLYDLRTAKDAKSVELSYRAKVWQRTGEDWRDVRLLLSTAQPQLGAQGPDVVARWVDLYRNSDVQYEHAPDSAAPAPSAGFFFDDGDGSWAARPENHFASVLSEGLSVRFELPERETVQSRDDTTSVLIGKQRLAVAPEYYCAPALDTTVWLRGRATNSSKWTLLPGRASVFFGQDFLGHAWLDAVQPEEEFDLHLGAVPTLSVERIQTQGLTEGPGFMGSDSSKVTAWKHVLKNNGTTIGAQRGVVRVVVQESIPRSQDEKVEVDVDKESTPHSQAERWKQDREEKNVWTWIVPVPDGGEAALSWRLVIDYPKGGALQFH